MQVNHLRGYASADGEEPASPYDISARPTPRRREPRAGGRSIRGPLVALFAAASSPQILMGPGGPPSAARPRTAGRVQSPRVPRADTRSDGVEIEPIEPTSSPSPEHRAAASALPG